MNVIKKIKQSFCKHDMQKKDAYETKVIKDGKIIKCEKFELYECFKCGKEETIVVPKFIPRYLSIYNDL